MSVRIRLGIVLGAFIIILLVVLAFNYNASQASAENTKEIDSVGLLRTLSTQVDLLTREVTAAGLNNENTTLAIENSVREKVELNESILRLFASSSNISREEFRAFLTGFEASFPDVDSIQYVPRVRLEEREAFELSVAADGFDGFTIYERNQLGLTVSAGQRDNYYPITYVEPFNVNQEDLGFDIGSNAGRLEALETARDSGVTIASEPIRLVQATNQSSVLFVTPVYRAGVRVDTLESRQENLQGFVVLVLDMQSFVDTALSSLIEGGTILGIEDVTEGPLGSPFFASEASTTAEIPITATLPVTVLARRWLVTIPQEIDVDAAETQLTATVNDIQTRVEALREGDEELGYYGLERHSNPDIIPAYEQMIITEEALHDLIDEFINTRSELDRAALLDTIEVNTNLFSDQTAALTALLNIETEDRIDQSLQFSVVVAGIALVIAALGVFTTLQIIRNLSRLNQSALQLAGGNLNTRVNVVGRNELGQIGRSVNAMAEQLQGAFGSLEQRIAERTRDLETVVDVTNQISTILDVNRLQQDVVDLTKERFRLYHAHIYLLDASGHTIVLATGAGHVGRQMVAEKRSIALNNPQSIVAEVARTRQTRIVDDVKLSPTFLPHPLLPDTRSEMALALIARGNLIGVLDVQSDQPGYFTPEIVPVFETLAGQIAVGLNNARLFGVAEETSRHEKALSAITQRLQGASNLDEVLQVAVRELGKALRVPYTAIELHIAADRTMTEPLIDDNGYQVE